MGAPGLSFAEAPLSLGTTRTLIQTALLVPVAACRPGVAKVHLRTALGFPSTRTVTALQAPQAYNALPAELCRYSIAIVARADFADLFAPGSFDSNVDVCCPNHDCVGDKRLGSSKCY